MVKTLLKNCLVAFSVGIIIFGIYNIIENRNKSTEFENQTNSIADIAGVSISEKQEIRTRDPFSTDYGEEYYFGLDDTQDIDIEVKQASTINSKSTGNYYMDMDYDAVKAEYPGMVAYLKVNGTNIEYPIAQAKDNQYYLKHDINNEESRIGWPFIDCDSDVQQPIGNTVIYGHNIKNKTMFGELHNLIDNKKWFNTPSNYEIYLNTDTHLYVYKIFSIYNASPFFNYFETNFNSVNDFDYFMSQIKEKNKVSGMDTDIDSTQILTLSTCYNSGRERLVIHAYLLRDKPITN